MGFNRESLYIKGYWEESSREKKGGRNKGRKEEKEGSREGSQEEGREWGGDGVVGLARLRGRRGWRAGFVSEG